MKRKYPFLKRYVGNWPVREYLKEYFRQNRYYTKRARKRRIERGQDPDDDSSIYGGFGSEKEGGGSKGGEGSKGDETASDSEASDVEISDFWS